VRKRIAKQKITKPKKLLKKKGILALKRVKINRGRASVNLDAERQGREAQTKVQKKNLADLNLTTQGDKFF